MIEYENLKKLNAPFREDYLNKCAEVIDSGWFILGNQLSQFETAFAEYCQTDYCAGVASGLDAILLAIKAYNFEKGTEIIVPSNTYIATILAIKQAGFTPVLVEPNIETYNIDYKLIEEKINSKTKAIIVVHLYGKCCDMDEINLIAKKHNLIVIEDAAQAHGATYKGKKAGNLANIAAFSFYPTKNLGALGDSGGITTNDTQIIEQIKMARNYGSKTKYYNEIVGWNSRLDEIQAGFLSIKLASLDLINTHKQQLAKLYFDNLKNDFIKPSTNINGEDVFHIFNIRHEKRDELKAYLLQSNIKTEIHYPVAPHQQKALTDDNLGHFPIAELIHNTTLSLPISFCHTEDEINYVIETLNKF